MNLTRRIQIGSIGLNRMLLTAQTQLQQHLFHMPRSGSSRSHANSFCPFNSSRRQLVRRSSSARAWTADSPKRRAQKLSQSSLSKKNIQSLMTACLISKNGTGDFEWLKARVANRRPLVSCVELSHHDSIFHIRESLEILYLDVVHVVFCTIRRQIGENDDDRFVARVVALNGLSAQE